MHKVFYSLLTVSVESPLYIHPHSKTVLTTAIRRDSHFLSTNMVMDYSLLVGLDDKKKELVVGIIGMFHREKRCLIY